MPKNSRAYSALLQNERFHPDRKLFIPRHRQAPVLGEQDICAFWNARDVCSKAVINFFGLRPSHFSSIGLLHEAAAKTESRC